MKKGWGRCLCIGLAVMLAVSPVLAGELETGAVDSSQQEADAAYRPVEETQEQTYTRWHMEYVDGTQYQVLMARKYGMAKEIADIESADNTEKTQE